MLASHNPLGLGHHEYRPEAQTRLNERKYRHLVPGLREAEEGE